jgi:D-threo-aldose 1-dehydrogenase
MKHRPLGQTAVSVPPIVFGTSCLGNLYEVLPDETKLATVREMFRCAARPVAFDSAGKYGAGLALETIGKSLRALSMAPADVLISNKLGWYRLPLRGPEPTFERGVWAGIQHDAESRISYDGILQCYAQGCELLGEGYAPQMVSVHDPDEFLARGGRMVDVLAAYRALFDLKAQGKVQAVGVGAKDWRVIRTIADAVALDWVMLACSLTVYSHPPELLAFCAQLHARGVGIINSAVFHAGFLTGGAWFDYRKPDPVQEARLFAWREAFFAVCRAFAVKPADACVRFGFAIPGVVAVALNTSKPARIADNVASVTATIPPAFWQKLTSEKLMSCPGLAF